MAMDVWKLQYQISPLILTNGIAGSAGGGALPFIAYSNPLAFSALTAAGGIFGGLGESLDDAFGAFTVAIGGQLVNQAIAKYPFPNQVTAGNATIRMPLTITLIWDTPMRGVGAWAVKLATFTALKGLLDNHNVAGGLYSVMTPAFTYTNLVMTGLSDASRGGSPLPQNAWRFDFERPLVSMAEAQQSAQQSQQIAAQSKGVPPTPPANPDPTTPDNPLPVSQPPVAQPSSSFPGNAGATTPDPVTGAGGGSVGTDIMIGP